MAETPTMKLNRTYEHQGRELRFWSLAPSFGVRWAIPSIPGYVRQFVWLWDAKDRLFVHAVVCDKVAKVIITKTHWEARRDGEGKRYMDADGWLATQRRVLENVEDRGLNGTYLSTPEIHRLLEMIK